MLQISVANPAKTSVTLQSDPWISWHPHTRELIFGWRRFFRNGTDPNGNTHQIEVVTTIDGINWSPPRIIMAWKNAYVGQRLSPSFVFNTETNIWYCYASDDDDMAWAVTTKRDLFEQSEAWSTPKLIGVKGWHGEARVLGDRVWLWNSTSHSKPDTSLWWSEPGDWTKFTRIDAYPGIIDIRQWAEQFTDKVGITYKNTFLPHLYSDGTISMKVLFQARPSTRERWLYSLQTPRLPYAD